ncbi:hypothetical protein ACFL9U_01675 [Thermodesulfobacteriota bacterium]
MDKSDAVGVFLCLGSFLLVIFEYISRLMNLKTEAVWMKLTLNDVVGAEYLTWIDGMKGAYLQKLFETIFNTPLAALFFGCGVLVLLFNTFRR